MPYTVYILHSDLLDRFYVGSTSDLQARVKHHLSNHQGFTGKAKDWQVVYSSECQNKSDALELEKRIKKRGAQRFLDDLQSG